MPILSIFILLFQRVLLQNWAIPVLLLLHVNYSTKHQPITSIKRYDRNHNKIPMKLHKSKADSGHFHAPILEVTPSELGHSCSTPSPHQLLIQNICAMKLHLFSNENFTITN